MMLSEPETARRAWTRLSRSLTEQRAVGKRSCSKCKKLKGLDDFYRRKDSKNRHQCKQCENAQKRVWRENNPEWTQAESARKWQRIKSDPVLLKAAYRMRAEYKRRERARAA